jgi:hypothetical protein
MKYELFYSSGGHGGRYSSKAAAIADAKRLMRGRPQERSIEVRREVEQLVPQEWPVVATVVRTAHGIRLEKPKCQG